MPDFFRKAKALGTNHKGWRALKCLRSFLGSDDTVAPGIKLRVFRLQLRMGKDIRHATAHAFVETCSCLETGDSPLQLRTVEDHGDALVAKEIAREVPFRR